MNEFTVLENLKERVFLPSFPEDKCGYFKWNKPDPFFQIQH